ncbi:MAG: hypothetical protein WBD10_10255 [Acidobacteriaceae bacterium]
MRKCFAVAIVLLVCGLACQAQPAHETWRQATAPELKALLPARAPVVRERIETERRTASGITDSKGKYVAGVVLITAGYSADGKYSHYFLTQVSLKIGDFELPPGSYLIGWEHGDDLLHVKFFDAASGRPLGSVDARLNLSIKRVESFRIWPPADRSLIQIGRFTFPYRIGD